ncbi:hypothetical protein BDN72DRAFT_527894 [Pluteus cervinus]|uniref:Uncharacterized protein n=1 Tax=Pluteus cervinus TaxID=181527 RepID=A0ACD3AXZ7_9AGAR|nr:hypothetical protein BDN72DRAFT_527894 [Pluteus cervinus]
MDTRVDIDDFPTEVLSSIFELVIPSVPASLVEAFKAPFSLSTCRRWRAIMIECLRRTPFDTFCPQNPAIRISGLWEDREHGNNRLQLPRLVLQVDRVRGLEPEPVITPHSRPPYQIAMEKIEELDLQLNPNAWWNALPLPNLRDTLADPPLRYLSVIGHSGETLFRDLQTTKFPHLTRLTMSECRVLPHVFARILDCAPKLEECTITLGQYTHYKQGPPPCTIRSTSLILLCVGCDERSKFEPCTTIGPFPKLEILASTAVNALQLALPFASSSIRSLMAYVPCRACADRPHDLLTLLEKCPFLEELIIPYQLLVHPIFFDKISSGGFVPNLRKLECGPSSLSTASLVGFLQKKGFVDASPTASDSRLCPFQSLRFRGMFQSSRTGIEESLQGVTNLIEFID